MSEFTENKLNEEALEEVSGGTCYAYIAKRYTERI
jgi:hypothetical protein